MTGRYARHSKVMTIANRLVKQGYNRANAMVKAWALVKMPQLLTKRQKAIEHLKRYAPELITISLYRDTRNAYDKNAIAVIATVQGKGSYTMGYVPKALAAFIAPLIDSGKRVYSTLRAIKGLYQPYMNYGLEIEVIV